MRHTKNNETHMGTGYRLESIVFALREAVVAKSLEFRISEISKALHMPYPK